ncbi:MAG: hypothetical protein L0387_19865 [Acidobacteria bacterium]|nr:hypothetical protein [Acidobacteriota bacterium]MCI0623881.1 hypothetical protein [Acidobacteriota bacterium]
MRRVVLFDLDSTIPNLALLKLSTYYKKRGFEVLLARQPSYLKADEYLASAVFHTELTKRKIAALRAIYGADVEIGGSGIDLAKRLPLEAEACFPDYSLYKHQHYAIGFLTRGCPKRCAFCVVPVKEGPVKKNSTPFSDFVPTGQRNVMLLDDNLLSFAEVESVLVEMARRRYAVNFSQTLDIAYLTPRVYELLLKVNYQNARFTRKRIYFSCNHPGTSRQFTDRKDLLKGFGMDAVCVVCMYGFDTSLNQDYQRWMMLRRLRLVPFFQEYWPIPGIPARLPSKFFDMDLNEVIRLTFRSNGQNWEKYLRWLNRLYFHTYGKYYLPLLNVIYRYNRRECIRRYLQQPEVLTTELYCSYQHVNPLAAQRH